MKTIRDPNFIQSFLRRFAEHKVNRYDLSRWHVEIHGNSGHGLRINLCRASKSVIELGWNRNGAWPCASVFDAFEHCDDEALSRCVRTFLRKHDLVDRDGRSMLEVDKEIELILRLIAAFGRAIASEDWSSAREMWDLLSTSSAIQNNPSFASVGELLRTQEALARPAIKGIH
jgi:hypothetical protein